MKSLLLVLLVGCSSSPSAPASGDDMPMHDAPIATADSPAPPIDASIDSPVVDGIPAGFGTLGGPGCPGVLDMDLTSPDPKLLRIDFDFMRAYMDPADRPLLTAGGQHLAATPNAGGSSGLSEIFAFEELARCEGATFLKSETEIMYDTMSKKTDLEIELRGHKIGVSVTRAFAYPIGSTYTLEQATTLIQKKLNDIPLSTASVSAADRWDKQFLSIEAIDQASADTMAQAWANQDATTKGDTVVLLITTTGEDTFIYTNQ